MPRDLARDDQGNLIIDKRGPRFGAAITATVLAIALVVGGRRRRTSTTSSGSAAHARCASVRHSPVHRSSAICPYVPRSTSSPIG